MCIRDSINGEEVISYNKPQLGGDAHADALIIFGTVIDDEMGDEVKVTVVAAGFDRWDSGATGSKAAASKPVEAKPTSPLKDLFADDAVSSLDDDDDLDVPSFLK